MPQFCILFYANYTILATQKRGGGMAPCPLKTPLIALHNLEEKKDHNTELSFEQLRESCDFS